MDENGDPGKRGTGIRRFQIGKKHEKKSCEQKPIYDVFEMQEGAHQGIFEHGRKKTRGGSSTYWRRNKRSLCSWEELTSRVNKCRARGASFGYGGGQSRKRRFGWGAEEGRGKKFVGGGGGGGMRSNSAWLGGGIYNLPKIEKKKSQEEPLPSREPRRGTALFFTLGLRRYVRNVTATGASEEKSQN